MATTLLEDNIYAIIHEIDTSFWSIDSVGPVVRSSILKKSARVKFYLYIVLAIVIMFVIVVSPLCGSNKEWILAEVVFDQYLRPWSNIFYHLYICSILFLIYATSRSCAIFLYEVAEISLQVYLINQRILQVCDDKLDFDRLKIGERISYQNKIFRTLCACIEHHVIVTRYGSSFSRHLHQVTSFTGYSKSCSII